MEGGNADDESVADLSDFEILTEEEIEEVLGNSASEDQFIEWFNINDSFFEEAGSSRATKRSSSPGGGSSIIENFKTQVCQKKLRVEIQKLVETGDIKHRIWFEAREPTPYFCERKAKWKELRVWILESEFEDRPVTFHSQVTVICGPGGVGKTEFARYAASKLSSMSIVWINAENKAQLSSSFRRLAESKLEIPAIDRFGKEVDPKAIAQLCFEFFSNSKVLFIFDNANSYKDKLQEDGIEGFLPTYFQPQWTKPNILITTRSSAGWKDFHLIPMEGLTREECLDYLNKNLGFSLPELYIRLMTELNSFPHTLRSAVCYIKNIEAGRTYLFEQVEGNPVSEFLERCQKDKDAKAVLEYEFWQNTQDPYEQTAFTIWNVTQQKILLTENGELANSIMSICSFFAPDEIPAFVFWESDLTKDVTIKAIETLVSYGSVNKKEGFLYIHRLSQKVVRLKIGPDNSKTLLLAVKRLKPYFTKLEPYYDKKRATLGKLCLPHGIQVAKYIAESPSCLENNPELADFIIIVLSALNSLGPADEAIRFGIKYVEIFELVLGNCQTTLELTNALGEAHINIYENRTALKLYIRIYPLSIELLSSTHPTTRAITNNRAYLLMCGAAFQKALEMFTANFYQSPLDVEKLKALMNIGVVTKCMHNYDEARSILEKALKIARENQDMFGETHNVTIRIKYELALVYIFINRSAVIPHLEASPILIEYVKYNESRFGLKDCRTLKSYVKVIEDFVDSKKFSEAEKQLNEIAPFAEDGLGKYSPPFLHYQELEARLKRERGLMTLEEEMQMHVEQIRIKLEELKFKPTGGGVMRNEKNIARIFYEKKEYDRALEKGLYVKETKINYWGKNDHVEVKEAEEFLDKVTMAFAQCSLDGNTDETGSAVAGADQAAEEHTAEPQTSQSTGPQFSCPYSECLKVYTHKNKLVEHIAITHSDNPPRFECSRCGRVFNTRYNLQRHEARINSCNPIN